MLFDLRGRGRRRTVQVIYLALAILMGGGLVFFGIGGSVSGGLFDAIGLTDGGQGSSSGGRDILKEQEKAAARRTRANPRDAAAWGALARARFQLAGQGENYDQTAGNFTPKGRTQLRSAVAAWDRYLALEPRRPDPGLAAVMVQALAALQEPQKAVRAAEIVAQDQQSSQAYYRLAGFAYAAGQTRKGDLAGKKAVALAPKAQRAGVKAQVDAIKQSRGFPGTGGGAGAAGSSPAPASP